MRQKRFRSREDYAKWKARLRELQKIRLLSYLEEFSKPVPNIYQRRIHEKIQRFILAEKLRWRVRH